MKKLPQKSLAVPSAILVVLLLSMCWSGCSGGGEGNGEEPIACENDGDCPTGHYCSLATHFCEEVVPCNPPCSAPTPVCHNDGSCTGCGTTGCAAGQICNQTSGLCEEIPPDPCENIICEPGEKCDPGTQLCVPLCDVVAQDCEDPTNRCTIDGNGKLICEAAGSLSGGEPCGASGYDDCSKGYLCAGSHSTGHFCKGLCNRDTCEGCVAGTGCFGLGDGQGGQIPGVGVCEDVGTPCDVMAQDCGAGEKCTLKTSCGDMGCVSLAGSVGIGESCDHMQDDCAAGLICLNMGSAPICFQFCMNSSDCPAGMSCYGFSEKISVGHCMPD
jgi:hypothetical protein